ncbi:hypothetical protein V2P11_10845, partial [Parageobacillus toebii]|uniref:hypothetical protein n=1 Tax=Parageobacillus toebii TaxID=153151 RepID=UPI0035C6E813
RHAASVRPEPGSNSPKRKLIGLFNSSLTPKVSSRLRFSYCLASAPSSLVPNNLPPRSASTSAGEEHLASRANRGASAFRCGRFVLFSFQRTFFPLCDLFMLTHSLTRCQYYFRHHLATLNNLPQQIFIVNTFYVFFINMFIGTDNKTWFENIFHNTRGDKHKMVTEQL